MSRKAIIIVLAILAAAAALAVKVPVYKATAVTCSQNGYHHKSLIKGDRPDEIRKEVGAINAQMSTRFCAASGEIRYELFVF